MSSPGCLPSISNPNKGPLLTKVRPCFRPECSFSGVVSPTMGDEYPIHSDRATQRSVVRHRIGTCAGGEAKTKIEQAIPDVGGGAVIGETNQFVIIGAA